MDEWLECKIEKLDPELQRMIEEVWECDNLDELKGLLFKWQEEGIFDVVDNKEGTKREHNARSTIEE